MSSYFKLISSVQCTNMAFANCAIQWNSGRRAVCLTYCVKYWEPYLDLVVVSIFLPKITASKIFVLQRCLTRIEFVASSFEDLTMLPLPGNPHRWSITLRLTSCLAGEDSAKQVNLLLFNISKAGVSKQVKQETSGQSYKAFYDSNLQL